MPIYEFCCDGCGRFEERRTLEESKAVAHCPRCGTAARRVYSTPNLKVVPVALSDAMGRAEKSAHEPGVARRPEGVTWPGRRYRPGSHEGHGH